MTKIPSIELIEIGGARKRGGYIYRQGTSPVKTWNTMGMDVSSKNENFALQYGSPAYGGAQGECAPPPITPPPSNRRIRFTD